MVVECLMASATSIHASLHQDQGMCRATREFHPFLPGQASRYLIPGNIRLKPPQHVCSDTSEPVEVLSAVPKPVLVDIQDVRPDSVLFSFGIAEKCARHEKILQFLMSGSNNTAKRGIDVSVVSDLMGLHTLAIDMHHLSAASVDDDFCLYEIGTESSLLHPRSELYIPIPILNYIEELSRSSFVTVHPDGQVLFTGTESEVQDLLSVISEFYSRVTTNRSKQAMLVPHFDRMTNTDTRASMSGFTCKPQPAPLIPPLTSPKKLKLKPLPRKKTSRKLEKERDLFRKNYFHACESLLSLLIDKRRCQKTAIISLKKSGPELPKLLTGLSCGVAGTGLAIVFSVMCKIAGPRVSFSAAKLLNTGFGFGLVWLSCAVNRLRDAVVCVIKPPRKLGLTEDEMMRRVDRSLNEIIFRAATLVAVVVMRFA